MSFWSNDEFIYYDNIESLSDNQDNEDTYIDSENIEEQIVCFRAEYAFEMSRNSQLQNEREKIQVRIRRRKAIIDYYDDDDDGRFDTKQLENTTDVIDIDNDYKNVIHTIQIQEPQLEQDEDAEKNANKYKQYKHQSSMTMFDTHTATAVTAQIFTAPHSNRNRTNTSNKAKGRRARAQTLPGEMDLWVISANILYQVSNENQRIEKQWMRCLRNKKFKLFVNKHRKHRLKRIKKETEQKLQELDQQIHIKHRIEQLRNAQHKLKTLEKARIAFIRNAAGEIDGLRDMIKQ
eukprot:394863_1